MAYKGLLTTSKTGMILQVAENDWKNYKTTDLCGTFEKLKIYCMFASPNTHLGHLWKLFGPKPSIWFAAEIQGITPQS